MSRGVILAVVLALSALVPIGGYFYTTHEANLQIGTVSNAHASLKSSIERNSKLILNMAVVPASSVPDVQTRIKKAITGAFGEQGGRAVFQLVLEHNPHTDLELVSQYEVLTAKAQAEFSQAQAELQAQRSSYLAALAAPIQGRLLKLGDYTEKSIEQWQPLSVPNSTEHRIGLN